MTRSGDDIRAQTRLSLENLSRLLAERNLAEEDVVKVTIWVRNASDFLGFNDTYADFFGAHRPA